MKKRITSLALLAILLTSAILTACSSGETGSAADTTKAGGQPETTAAETTAPPEYVSPGIKYDGREFTFGSYQEKNPNWTSRKYTESYVEAENGDVINDAIYQRTVATEEELGIKIKPAHYDNINIMTQATLAGDHYADCIIMLGTQLKTVQNNDLALDLNSIDTLELDKSWWNQSCAENFSLGGKLFGAAGDISVIGLLASHCVYFNDNMIENFGLDNPYDDVREGKWTLDRNREYATAVASDLNGDGVMDGNDRFGLSSEALGVVRMLASGVTLTEKDKNDFPVLSIDEERAATAVEKFVTLWRDKNLTLFSSDFAGKYSNVFRDFIFQLFISDRVLFINNWLVWTLDLRVMESDFGILPPPKLDEAQEDYLVGMTEGFTTYVVVPITLEDTDYVGTVMNALGYYGQMYLYPALMDTTVTSKAIRDEDSLEMLELIYNNRYYEPAALYDWGSIGSLLSSFISQNSTDFMSKFESGRPAIEAAIQKTVESLS